MTTTNQTGRPRGGAPGRARPQRARRARGAGGARRQPPRRGPRHRLPARAGPLLPDGPDPAARRRGGAPGASGPPGRPRRPRGGARAPDERPLLRAYPQGVGAGLAALGAPPPEYLLLRSVPAAWKEEDAL